jgi:hypothetical protein
MYWKRGTSTMAVVLHRSDIFKLKFLGITEDGGAELNILLMLTAFCELQVAVPIALSPSKCVTFT